MGFLISPGRLRLMFMHPCPAAAINQPRIYCPLVGLTSVILTAVIHQRVVGSPPRYNELRIALIEAGRT